MFTSRKFSPKVLLGCGRSLRESLDDWACTPGAHSSHAWTRHLKSAGRGRIRTFVTKKDLSPSGGISFGLDQTVMIPSSSLWAYYSYSPQTWISTLSISASFPTAYDEKRLKCCFKHPVQKHLPVILIRTIILHGYAREGQKRRKKNGEKRKWKKKKKAVLSAKKGKAAAAPL